ncbi:MAG: cation transporter [Candidatus Atribacteria bacterium]|nr:cation transporter [Candidatus Atribacteria bacterium]
MTIADHRHHHNPDNQSNKRIISTIILKLFICVVEIIGGLLSGSLSLLADAMHNFTDGVAVLISFLARKIGRRSPDEKMTFGYRRAEILAALLNSSVIIAISLSLFKEAYFRFRSPQEILVPSMLVVGVFGFLADLLSVYLLHPEARQDMNMRAAYLHLLGDALSSIGIIIAGIIIYFSNFYIIDPILTVAIALFILTQGYQILRQSTLILMERVPAHLNTEDIQKKVETIPEISSLHHVHIWQIDEDKFLFEGHITLNRDMKVSEADEIRKKVEEILSGDFNIHHPHLQLEFSYCNNQKCE